MSADLLKTYLAVQNLSWYSILFLGLKINQEVLMSSTTFASSTTPTTASPTRIGLEFIPNKPSPHRHEGYPLIGLSVTRARFDGTQDLISETSKDWDGKSFQFMQRVSLSVGERIQVRAHIFDDK